MGKRIMISDLPRPGASVEMRGCGIISFFPLLPNLPESSPPIPGYVSLQSVILRNMDLLEKAIQ
jgi:hypothetical protein